MILWRMACFAGCCQVAHPVRMVSLPESQMMAMEFCVVFDSPSAEAALISVPQKYCLAQGFRPVSWSLLVIGSFRRRLYGFDCLQKLGIEGPHLEGCLRNRDHFRILLKQTYLLVHAVLDTGRKPTFFFGSPAVLKPGFPVTQPVPPLPAVSSPCIMSFGFVSEKVPLFAHIFVLL